MDVDGGEWIHYTARAYNLADTHTHTHSNMYNVIYT